MNNVILIGRLVADPEVKYSNDGNSIARFKIAVDRKFKTENGPTADFISCIAFGKKAEVVEKYFQKGKKIGVIGRIQTGSYKNRDNQTVYTTDVVADDVEFVESKSQEQQNQQPNQQKPANHAGAGDGFMNIPDGIDEELPFS